MSLQTTAYDPLIQQIATQFGLPVALFQSQVIEESGGDRWAFRYEPSFFHLYIQDHATTAHAIQYGPLAACSYGLIQILLETATEEGFAGRPEDLFDPELNLTLGAKHLRRLWDERGGTQETYRLALAAYNGKGPAADAYATAIYQRAGLA